MLLEGKNAIIYGGGGAIGGAVARAFASEGARVFLTGRTQGALDAVAADIRAAGGRVETALVDATDAAQVDAHADAVADGAGGLDISFNAITHGDVQGTPMADMALEDYRRPIVTAVTTTFLTMRAAARLMRGRPEGGVVLLFGGDGDPPRDGALGGLQTAFAAQEQMRRQLAVEHGAEGVRSVTIRTGGIPESIPPGHAARDAIAASIAGETLTGRAATLADVGAAAAFAVSDRARAMTGATLNVSAGALID